MNLEQAIEMCPELFHALTTGEEFEYIFDVECGDVVFDHTSRGWSCSTYVMGFSVNDGVPFVSEYVMGDGDCDCNASWDLRDPVHCQHAEANFAANASNSRKSLCEYYQYVADTGHDPLDEFYQPLTHLHEKQQWAVTFRKHWSHVGDMNIASSRIVATWRQMTGTHVFEEQVYPPDRVADYARLELRTIQNKRYWTTKMLWREIEGYATAAKHPRETQTWTQMDCATMELDPECWTVLDSFDMTWPNPNYTAELQAHARKAANEISERYSLKGE